MNLNELIADVQRKHENNLTAIEIKEVLKGILYTDDLDVPADFQTALANQVIEQLKEKFGDRECPDCLKESLVEQGLAKWKCLNCGKVFDEEWLDASDD